MDALWGPAVEEQTNKPAAIDETVFFQDVAGRFIVGHRRDEDSSERFISKFPAISRTLNDPDGHRRREFAESARDSTADESVGYRISPRWVE
jgi:hypothetical protein